MEFIWKISQILEVSLEQRHPVEMSKLEFVVQETFRQIFSNFDRSYAVFSRLIEGHPYDPNIPGVPTPFFFGHIPELRSSVKWNEFKTVVRYYAVELYTLVLAYSNLPQFQSFDFTYRNYPLSGGGLTFVLHLVNKTYDI